MEKTIKIIDRIRITKVHINMFRVAFEDELLAVLVGDKGNHLIAQLSQEAAGRVCVKVSCITLTDDAGIRTA
jgi:hypothetical protein